MIKRDDKLIIFNIAFSQIFLLMTSIFALGFLFSQINFVSGYESGGIIVKRVTDTIGTNNLPVPNQALSVLGGNAEVVISGEHVVGSVPKQLFKGVITNVESQANGQALVTLNSAGKETTITMTKEGYPVLQQGLAAEKLQLGVQQTGVEAKFGFWNPEINIFGDQAGNFFAAHLLEGVVWGGILALGIKLLGPSLGLSEKQSNAAAAAVFGGFVAGKALYGGIAPTGALNGGFFSQTGAFFTSAAVGALITLAILAATYKKENKKLVSFQCLPFEPPIKGEKCEECNKDPFRPCSEYRCRSLGQACQILNPGTNEERCAWVSPKDVNSPTIETWDEALKPKGLKYVPDNTIRPPNRGVKIIGGGKDGCIKPFTPLEFGIRLNEPAQCKIDYNHTAQFDNMQFYFGGSNYHRYNHTQNMKLPGPDKSNASADIAPELKNDGFFSLFVRCRDANKNENVDEFVFNFCVDPSPDTTPPVIEGTSIKSGGFVQFKAQNIPLEIYVNEPAECKWSRESKAYEDMENKMNCLTETYQINADLNYICKGNLTGLKDQQDNKFYFRCKDQPDKAENERNVNTQSHELVLKGSQPLSILGISPNGTVPGNTDTLTVELFVKTNHGAEEGKSICYFSNTGKQDTYITMFETNSFEHKQKLDLVAGEYQYFFRCIDLGGNRVDNTTLFNVTIDKQPPKVTRAYKDEGLKIVTNEDAECVYDSKSCNYEFKEGLPLLYSNPSIKRNHFIEWKQNDVYHIKCQDLYDNKPGPTECTLIVNAVELTRRS